MQECCSSYHSDAPALTAVDLVKARISGFTLGLEPFLLKTYHPDSPASLGGQLDLLGRSVKRTISLYKQHGFRVLGVRHAQGDKPQGGWAVLVVMEATKGEFKGTKSAAVEICVKAGWTGDSAGSDDSFNHHHFHQQQPLDRQQQQQRQQRRPKREQGRDNSSNRSTGGSSSSRGRQQGWLFLDESNEMPDAGLEAMVQLLQVCTPFFFKYGSVDKAWQREITGGGVFGWGTGFVIGWLRGGGGRRCF